MTYLRALAVTESVSILLVVVSGLLFSTVGTLTTDTPFTKSLEIGVLICVFGGAVVMLVAAPIYAYFVKTERHQLKAAVSLAVAPALLLSLFFLIFNIYHESGAMLFCATIAGFGLFVGLLTHVVVTRKLWPLFGSKATAKSAT